MLCVAIQGCAKRSDLLRGGKGWHDLKLDNFCSLFCLTQTLFCSFLTIRAGAVRGYTKLCKAMLSGMMFCVGVKVGMI